MTLRPLIRDLVRGPLRSPLDRRGGWTPAILFPSGQAGIWLQARDLGNEFQDSAGTTPAAVNSPIGLMRDKRPGGTNNVLQATAPNRPTLKQVSSILSNQFDGVDDNIAMVGFAAGTFINGMDIFITVKRNSAAKGVVASRPASVQLLGCYDSADAVTATNGGSGTPTLLVNGAGVTNNRQALDTALPNGTWKLLEYQGLDLSAWVEFNLCGWGAGFFAAIDIAEVVLCPTQTAAVRSQIRTYMGNGVGLTL